MTTNIMVILLSTAVLILAFLIVWLFCLQATMNDRIEELIRDKKRLEDQLNAIFVVQDRVNEALSLNIKRNLS